MTRYITLFHFTEQGAKNIQESPARARAFRAVAKKAGVKVEGQFWTVGAYDGMVILSADDEKKVLQCLTELAALGNLRTETLRAFIDTEFSSIVGGE
jgi:uncharacterized protein with GYD domain